MSTPSLLSEGTTLMLFGMGFVFIFLTLLVFVTSVMSRLITLYEKSVGVLPESGVSSPTAVIRQHRPVAQSEADSKTLIAVFTAAIHKYRSRHK